MYSQLFWQITYAISTDPVQIKEQSDQGLHCLSFHVILWYKCIKNKHYAWISMERSSGSVKEEYSVIILRLFSIFLHKNICCGYSLETSRCFKWVPKTWFYGELEKIISELLSNTAPWQVLWHVWKNRLKNVGHSHNDKSNCCNYFVFVHISSSAVGSFKPEHVNEGISSWQISDRSSLFFLQKCSLTFHASLRHSHILR